MAQLTCRVCLLPLRVGQQATAERQGHALPDAVACGCGLRPCARQARAMRLDTVHQHLGFGPLRTGQAVQVLQVQKGQYMVVHAWGQVVAQVLPPVAHIYARQLQPRQQRHGADLVLGIGLVHAPDLFVVDAQHLVVQAEVECKQGQVPPVMRHHERIQASPGAAAALHERPPFGESALGEHDVRQRMLRPGLLGA